MKDAGGRTARETILSRIREALRQPAPLPHLSAHAAAPQAAAGGGLPQLAVLPAEAARPWLPDGGDTPADQRRILVDNLGKLRAVVQQVPDVAAAATWLRTLAAERGWQRVACHGHPLLEAVLADQTVTSTPAMVVVVPVDIDHLC